MGRRLSLMSIAVANLLGAVEYSIVMPSLYGYLNTFGETQDWFFGLVLSSFQLSQLLTSSLFGSDKLLTHTDSLWIDKRPMREVIIAAIAFSILGNMLYVFSWSHWMVLVSRAISGIGGNVVVASNTYVVRATPPERRSAVAAKVFSFSNLGLLAGPAFNFVLAFFNWEIGPIKIDPLNGAGLLMSALLVAGLIFILSCFEEPSKTHSAEHGETKQELTKSEKYKELIKPAVITIFVADFILAFNQTCLETFLTPLTKKYWGWEQFQNSLLYSGLTILFVFWFVSITFLSRVLQDRALILIGHVFTGAALAYYLTFAFVMPIDWTFPLYLFLIGLGVLASGMPFFGASVGSLLSKHISNPAIHGTSQGILTTVTSVGNITGPLWAGFSLDQGQGLRLPLIPIGAMWVVLSILIGSNWKRLSVSVKKSLSDSGTIEPDEKTPLVTVIQ